MELHTPRLTLRPYSAEDFAAVHRFASDPQLATYVEWGPNTRQDSRDFLASCLAEEQADPRTAYTFAITRSDGGEGAGEGAGEPIGTVGLTLDPTRLTDDGGATDAAGSRTGEVGYVIAANQWGRGYATEATAAVVGFGFEVLGLERIRATCRPSNAASARVLEKAGLVLQARLPRHKLIRGQWEDSLLYTISPS